MYQSITISPAYGRDYRSRTAVLKAWDEGIDFAIEAHYPFTPGTGTYINKRDADKYSPSAEVRVRYNQQRHVTIVPRG